MLIAIIILLIAALALFLIAPGFGVKRAKKWRGTSFAHRGLHGEGAAENTLAAFERACRAGCGIELDVQLSRDGEVVVFHDDDLKRMLGDERRVDAVDFAELRSLALPDGSAIPSFEDVLRLVNGRVPLLVELKNGRRNAELCKKTLEQLRAYRGSYIVESFNPLILNWFKRNAPDIIRGQLVSNWSNYVPQFSRLVAFLLSNLALNFLARPDFVAYDVSLRFFAPSIQRALFHIPMAAWTVKDNKTYCECIARGEMPIFEGFLPERWSRTT